MFMRKNNSGELTRLTENVNELISDIKEIQTLMLGMSCDLNNFKNFFKKNNKKNLLDDHRFKLALKEISANREVTESKETRKINDLKMTIVSRVKYYLSTVDHLKTTEILELLDKEGINIASKNPSAYISNILTNSLLFYYSDGWRLNTDFVTSK